MADESESNRTLYCGNLSDQVTDELLFELFLQAGPVEKVSLPQLNGRNRPYGFVTFKHSVSVPYAIQLMNGIRLLNRPLSLQPRNNSSSDMSAAGTPGSGTPHRAGSSTPLASREKPQPFTGVVSPLLPANNSHYTTTSTPRLAHSQSWSGSPGSTQASPGMHDFSVGRQNLSQTQAMIKHMQQMVGSQCQVWGANFMLAAQQLQSPENHRQPAFGRQQHRHHPYQQPSQQFTPVQSRSYQNRR